MTGMWALAALWLALALLASLLSVWLGIAAALSKIMIGTVAQLLIGWTYTTLLMSTGLTFGTISALFWLSHSIIDQQQYSILVACVIGSAVIPTLIANAFFLSRHLMLESEPETSAAYVSDESEVKTSKM